MIDYDKLRTAHELADKIDCICEFDIFTNENASLFKINYERIDRYFHKHESYINIDNLITKLTELTQSKPKYEIGQEVWFIDCEDEIDKLIVGSIDSSGENNNYYYSDQGGCVKDSDGLYLSREALIEAQIDYWKGMQLVQIETIQECQHETETGKRLSYTGEFKCKKCGEFYR